MVMVNLILVSHSHTLAMGVAELAEQMNNGCQIAVAAGMSEPENAIGTDAVKIMLAIEEVYSPDGVLILMDLGSAILSAETALELIDPEMAANVKLCAAPLVEGTLAAVVSASAGASLDTVAKEAEGALAAKLSQLGGESQNTNGVLDISAHQPPADALIFSWQVQNPNGLHARPTARLVEVLSPFSAQVWLEKQGKWADAKSYNQLIQLQVRKNEAISFHFSGEQSQQAYQALKELAHQHFGETVENAVTAQRVYGKPVLSFISEGQVVTFQQQFTPSSQPFSEQLFEEKQQQIEQALTKTQQQIAELSHSPYLNHSFAGIFQAHQLLLDDLKETIFEQLPQCSVVEACYQVLDEMRNQYLQLEDPYLQARALDIDDLRHRILHNLLGISVSVPEVAEDRILVADELYPSTLVSLLANPPQGICLQQGSLYSHTALIAKSANIPLLVQANDILTQFTDGDKLCVNWFEGVISYQ